MSDGAKISIACELDPTRETKAAIGKGLDAYNERFAGPEKETPLWLVARTGDGQICAGLHGKFYWDRLYIDWLWVADAHRCQGLGSQLLVRAEEFVRDRGCGGVFLNTFSFQAPKFYPRHGYQEFGRIEDFPKGHTQLWFAKRF